MLQWWEKVSHTWIWRFNSKHLPIDWMGRKNNCRLDTLVSRISYFELGDEDFSVFNKIYERENLSKEEFLILLEAIKKIDEKFLLFSEITDTKKDLISFFESIKEFLVEHEEIPIDSLTNLVKEKMDNIVLPIKS